MLSSRGLRKYVEAEFDCFRIYVKHICATMLRFTEGNPFAQCLHDCATLANHHKCIAVGSEFIDCTVMQQHALNGRPLYGVEPPEGRDMYWRDLWEADMAFVMKIHSSRRTVMDPSSGSCPKWR